MYFDQIKCKECESTLLQCPIGAIELQDQTSTFSIYNRSESSSTKLNGNFLWFQLFIEVLLRITYTVKTAKEELVNLFNKTYCNNIIEQRKINEFDKDYECDQAIKWYTKDFCLYKLLNTALRKQDIDCLYTFRMYVVDIYKQLSKEHEQLKESSTNSILHVYRSQAISTTELERMKQSINEFISMKSFLSTSKNEEQASSFVLGGEPTKDLVYVLFAITANLRLNSKPFADITNLSAIGGEEEVLFMLGTIFRIKEVAFNKDKNLWIVSLELCSQDDNDLNSIFQYFKNNYGEKTSLWHLTDLLFDMNELDKAEKFYKGLIDEVSEYEGAICYDALGVIATGKAEYNLALMYHEKSLIFLKTKLSDKHLLLAYSYDHLGIVHGCLGNHDLALENHQQALDIWLIAFGDKDLKIAQCLINIGLIYDKKTLFQESLANYFYAQAIYQENNLPDDHPLFGLLFNNIGYIYFEQDDFIEALSYYKKSLDIRRKSLPAMHTDTGVTCHNIGALYLNQGNYLQALPYYEDAYNIYAYAYEKAHPRMIMVEKDIVMCRTLIVSKANHTIEDLNFLICHIVLKLQEGLLLCP
jgi:tetratricopeptide (TPR) repeat protein